MIVKICGITRGEDAEAAVAAGASALGFIFWPGSPRFVDPFRAKAIARRVPAFVTMVGVFVNQPAECINSVADRVPHLCKVSPAGKWHIEDGHRAGGVPAILNEIQRAAGTRS